MRAVFSHIGPRLARWVLASFFGLFIAAGCSDNSNNLPPSQVYVPAIRSFVFEVDYMEDMEPYTGETVDGDSYWDFLKNNVSALFDGTKKVDVPTTLTEMELIPSRDQNYSTQDLLDVALDHRSIPPIQEGKASIYVVFVDGFYLENGVANSKVLGVSVGDSGVIGLFKRAIKMNIFPNTTLRTFVEQSVLIHESGHALGLVNNGIDMVSDHQDSEHGAHCTNTKCVMYYLNEGAKDLIEFLGSGDPDTETILFGSECLADSTAAIH